MSCALCRLARIPCDRGLPCERCKRMGRAHNCFVPPAAKKGRPRTASRPLQAPVQPVLLLHTGLQGPTDAQPVPLPSSPPLELSTTVGANCLRETKEEMEQAKEEVRVMAAKIRGLEAKVRRMKKMKSHMREMRKRLRQLDDRNAQQLCASLHQQQQQQQQQQRRQQTEVPCLCPSRTTWLGGRGEEGVCDEMHWCFPFLKHYGDIHSGRFVVDDVHQKGVYVLTIQHKRPAVTFANLQFCHTTGYQLAELLDHKLVIQLCQPTKSRVMNVYRNKCPLGMSEILHCTILLEHKQGHMVATSSRLQYCFVAKVRYCVLVVDQVLGAIAVPSTISDIATKEHKEWREVTRAVKQSRRAAKRTHNDSVARQPPAAQFQEQQQNQEDVAAEEPSWDDLLYAVSTSSPFFSPAEDLHTGCDGARNH